MFRESTDDAAVASFFDEAAAMATQIPGITRFMHGRNCSPEGLSGDFTHMFVMSFENAAACDSYLPHREEAMPGACGGGVGSGCMALGLCTWPARMSGRACLVERPPFRAARASRADVVRQQRRSRAGSPGRLAARSQRLQPLSGMCSMSHHKPLGPPLPPTAIHEAFKAKWIPCLEKVFVMDI